jgi:hypothetical protein
MSKLFNVNDEIELLLDVLKGTTSGAALALVWRVFREKSELPAEVKRLRRAMWAVFHPEGADHNLLPRRFNSRRDAMHFAHEWNKDFPGHTARPVLRKRG